MKTLILINGAAGCGKDSFVEYVQEYCHKRKDCLAFNESSIAPVKEAMRWLGWNGESKEANDRACMAEIKASADKAYGFTVNFCITRAGQVLAKVKGNAVLFMHVREPKNLQEIKAHFAKTFSRKGWKCCTVLVRATGRNIKEFENEADRGVENYAYDICVENGGTLDDLRVKAYGFTSMLHGESWDCETEKRR